MQIKPSIQRPTRLSVAPKRAPEVLSQLTPQEPAESVQISGTAGVSAPSDSQSQGLLASSQATGLAVAGGAVGGGFSLLSKIKEGFQAIGEAFTEFASGETSAGWAARRQVNSINALEASLQDLSPAQLKAKTSEFKDRLKAGETTDDLMVEAYAVVREATRRETGLRLYDEQLEGGIHAHNGTIVEMKTGEGKTLMGLLPTYLNALTGDGVQVMTFNDYLAERDAYRAHSVFEKLGISVGLVQEGMDEGLRKQANQADVTYGAASEFGFQYLNDNLALDEKAKVGRDLSKVFVLVDEADSLLLDESRTPLLIADSYQEDTKPVEVFCELVKHLVDGQDYKTEQDKKTVWLTESGNQRVQKILGMGDLYEKKNAHLLPYLESALQAKAFLRKDEHYIIRDKEVLLIDEFTGRAKEDHHFSQGLHQAIQASEGLPIGETRANLASITYPNFLGQYRKLAGMTGTAASARTEFEDLGLAVRKVKTHKPMIRQEHPDLMFATKAQRNTSVAHKVQQLNAQGRPVLIGTRSIESSEALSQELERLGIEHNLLNARQPGREAAVVAQAGRRGAVTIATNMAGRGTDIKLGGDPKELAAWEASQGGGNPQDYLAKWESITAAEKQQVLDAGGLMVLGTERHESRRIDEQLVGRAGRQGDPGEAQFFISAEDDLFVRNLSDPPQVSEPITGALVDRFVKQAQSRSEGRNLTARRHLLKYDKVRNLQRESVYADRDAILSGANIMEALPELSERAARGVAGQHYQGTKLQDPARLSEHAAFLSKLPLSEIPKFESRQQFEGWLKERLQATAEQKKASLGNEAMGNVLGRVYLQILDDSWSQQQTDLDQLRDSAWMVSYAQQEPIIHYSLKAHQAYETMLDHVSSELMMTMLHMDARPRG